MKSIELFNSLLQSDMHFVLLGAGSAMGPLLMLLSLGANIIAIDYHAGGYCFKPTSERFFPPSSPHSCHEAAVHIVADKVTVVVCCKDLINLFYSR